MHLNSISLREMHPVILNIYIICITHISPSQRKILIRNHSGLLHSAMLPCELFMIQFSVSIVFRAVFHTSIKNQKLLALVKTQCEEIFLIYYVVFVKLVSINFKYIYCFYTDIIDQLGTIFINDLSI